MAFFEDPPRHDFPDHAIRRLLEEPANLRELIADLLPGLVDRFDFSRIETVKRDFLLEDWRGRESDLLFRIPYSPSVGATVTPALVCVLLEHQSKPDPPMPLRILLDAVLFWEREWKVWEATSSPRGPLRLTPVVPIVFHTGTRQWRTHRELTDLIGGPEELREWAPGWRPLFWDLAEHTPEELLGTTGEWLAALAVVRAERAELNVFQTVFEGVLRRLEGLSSTDRMRWHDLLWFVLSWGLRRRANQDRPALLEAARRSQMDVKNREEMEALSESVFRTAEEEIFARGRAAERVETRREDLRLLLEERFGTLPEDVKHRIDAATDAERLGEALRQVLRISSPSELSL